jgi:hypothetical protein
MALIPRSSTDSELSAAQTKMSRTQRMPEDTAEPSDSWSSSRGLILSYRWASVEAMAAAIPTLNRLGQEMGQEAPQIPADLHVARFRENRLKPCPT